MAVSARETGAVQTSGARIGPVTASALYVAAVLGTGLLALPGLAADAAGPASLVAVGIVFLLSIPLAGTFAAIAARHPDAGGVATAVRVALGATAARATGYWFLFGVAFGIPVVSMLGGEYVAAFTGLPRAAAGAIAVGFLAVALATAALGFRVSGAAQIGLTGLLVALVVLVVASAVPVADPGRLEPFLPHGWGGVGVAVSLFVWAFAGWEAITHWAGEFRDPRRTLPLATAVAVVVVGAAYLALQVVTVLAPEGGGSTPLLDLVALTLPGLGPAVVTGVAVVVVLGVLNAYLPAFANLAASLGRDGDLPRWFAVGAEPGAVPRRGLLLTAALGLGYLAVFLALGLDLEAFVLIHTSAMVAVYLLGTLAAVRLLPRFTVGWWLAVVAVVLVAGLVVLAGPNLGVPALLALVAIGVALGRRARAARRPEPVDSSRSPGPRA